MTRSDLIDLAPPQERAFLIAVETGTDDGWTAEESLAELASLADTAGAEVVGAEWQHRRHIDPNWYLGKGKAEELRAAKQETGFTLLVADDELSPNQQRALEELLAVKVLDRSGLILDIFAQHAQTHEGRLQVELAQLEYQLPRLTRMWTHLSRTGGGIGTRGPGETQLETDRRVIRVRIRKLKERVEQVRQQRETAGRSRDRRLVPSLAIVGYTNAGKSSLLNALAGREAARAEDRLFATLDPTSRQVKLGDGQSVVLTDTVGFIHKLPHQLVDAFRATLEEVTRADVLVEVVDGSDVHARVHRQTVQEVLDDLGAGEKPRIVALNKADLFDPVAQRGGALAPVVGEAVPVSALTGFGLDTLRVRISAVLADLWEDVDVTLPYAEGELLSRVRERGTVEVTYQDAGVRVAGRVIPSLAGELRAAARRHAPVDGSVAIP
jgi:GTPase